MPEISSPSEIVDRVALERVGHANVTQPLISLPDLEALEDTLDLLSDHEALKDIAAAREDLCAGRSFSADQLRAKYLRSE